MKVMYSSHVDASKWIWYQTQNSWRQLSCHIWYQGYEKRELH